MPVNIRQYSFSLEKKNQEGITKKKKSAERTNILQRQSDHRCPRFGQTVEQTHQRLPWEGTPNWFSRLTSWINDRSGHKNHRKKHYLILKIQTCMHLRSWSSTGCPESRQSKETYVGSRLKTANKKPRLEKKTKGKGVSTYLRMMHCSGMSIV